MQLGRWDLRLSPDTPMTIRQFIEPGDQIVITPTRTPFGGYPAYDFATITSGYEAQIDSVLGAARYRGPILEVGDRRTEIGGHGMLWYLGNGNGSGPITYSTNLTPRTWAQHLSAFIDTSSFTLTSAWNGITKVAGTSLPATTWPGSSATADDLPLNVLQRLVTLAGLLEVEFYVDAQGYFRHCGSSALFTTTPEVILMAGTEGRDLDLIGLRIIDLDRSLDWWTAATAVMAYSGSGTSYGQSSRSISTEMYGADGGGSEFYGAGAVSDTTAGAYAAKLDELEPRFLEQERFTATVDTYDPGRWMKPGDYLWVYDPINRVYDDTQATTYHGQHVTPAKLRLHGMDWSVRQGMGVYRIPRDHGGGSGRFPAVLDLTDYVIFEDSPCRLDLGAWQRSYDQ